jgi:hypothetical protein
MSRPAPARQAEHQAADKVFHVSPFFDVGGRYEFTLRAPDERFKLSIFKERADGSDFMATMAMNRADLTSGALVKLFASQPFSTLKTISAIHLEALKLWIKGAKYHSRPEPPEAASLARLSENDPEALGRFAKFRLIFPSRLRRSRRHDRFCRSRWSPGGRRADQSPPRRAALGSLRLAPPAEAEIRQL